MPAGMAVETKLPICTVPAVTSPSSDRRMLNVPATSLPRVISRATTPGTAGTAPGPTAGIIPTNPCAVALMAPVIVASCPRRITVPP